MKKNILLIVALGLLLNSCGTNKKLNNVVYNQEVEQKILIGKIDRKGLMKKPFKEWFTEEYDNYTPDKNTLAKLNIADNAEIIIVLATWCPDSRREVPRFYKILDEIGFDESKVTVYAVDRNLLAGDEDVAQYQIDKVPTIIYKHYGYEAGRIVETPSFGSLEKDLVDFTSRKGKK